MEKQQKQRKVRKLLKQKLLRVFGAKVFESNMVLVRITKSDAGSENSKSSICLLLQLKEIAKLNAQKADMK